MYFFLFTQEMFILLLFLSWYICTFLQPPQHCSSQVLQSSKVCYRLCLNWILIVDVEDTAKEGVDHVKEVVESAYTAAETTIGSMVEKVSNTISGTKTEVEETAERVNSAKDNLTANISNGITETVSEMETVSASTLEGVKETATSAIDDVFDKGTEFGEAIKEELKTESLHIEDLEQSMDTHESNYKEMRKKAEDLVNGLPTSTTTSPTPDLEAEEKKEE